MEKVMSTQQTRHRNSLLTTSTLVLIDKKLNSNKFTIQPLSKVLTKAKALEFQNFLSKKKSSFLRKEVVVIHSFQKL